AGSERYRTAFPSAFLSHLHSASLMQTSSPVAWPRPMLRAADFPVLRFSSTTCPLRLLSFKNSLAISAVLSEEALSMTINSSLLIGYDPWAMFDSFCSITLASLYVGIIMLTVGCVFGWSAR